MVDRIKQIMEYKKLTPAVFAEQLEISRSNLTHLFSGRNQPSLYLAKKILEKFPDINTEWLIMGVGNMTNLNLQEDASVSIKKESETGEVRYTGPDLFSSVDMHETDDANMSLLSNDNAKDESGNAENFSEPESDPASDKNTYVTSATDNIPRRRTTSKKANNSDGNQGKAQIFDSRGDKKVKKIVFFYVDKTFEEFYPE